jgi:hypothetical protein
MLTDTSLVITYRYEHLRQVKQSVMDCTANFTHPSGRRQKSIAGGAFMAQYLKRSFLVMLSNLSLKLHLSKKKLHRISWPW